MSEEQKDDQTQPKLKVSRKYTRPYNRVQEDDGAVDAEPVLKPSVQPLAEPEAPAPQTPHVQESEVQKPEPKMVVSAEEAETQVEPEPEAPVEDAEYAPEVIEPEIETQSEMDDDGSSHKDAAAEDVEILMPNQPVQREAPPKVVVTKTVEHAKQEARARALMREYMLGSSIMGLIPLPLVDIVAVSVMQTRMLMRMAAIYKAPVNQEKTRILVSSLLSSAAGVLLGGPLFGAVPVLGRFLRPFGSAVSSAATTYALGAVFIRHFESGGDLLNPSVEKYMARFEAELERSREALWEQFNQAGAGA